MTDYTVIESHADLGGIEAHPDRTREARPDDPTNANGPGLLTQSEANGSRPNA